MTQTCISEETKFATENFQYLGREWRLYKRGDGKNASWYFQIERHGKRYPTSLKTSAVKAAIESAKLLIDGAQQNKLEKIRAILGGREEQMTRDYCTVDKYLKVYENTPTGGAVAKTRHQFVGCFKRMLAKCPNPPTRMDQLGPMFKDARAQANKAIEAAPDNAAKMRIMRSFNSEVGNVASVFSEKAAYFLKDQLELPDFTSLRVDIKFLKFKDTKKTVSQYQPPTPEVQAKTIASWLELPRNEFLAVGMALACGLRKGEMKGQRAFVAGDYVWTSAVDWSWFKYVNGVLWCSGRGSFKGHKEEIHIQVLNPFWDMIVARCEKEKWERTGLVIAGNRSRFDKRISKWMRDLGWETRLHLHALRAWAGSLVFMKYGVDAACEFCRHEDKETTIDHYSWLRDKFYVAGMEITAAGKPVEWAREPRVATTNPETK